MDTSKHFCFWMVFSVVIMAAFHAQAATVNYTLDNVVLADGEQITGAFEWTYSAGDFEGGSGEFTALDIPYTIYSFADGNLNIDIQTNSIEISGNGNYHDVGLDITLSLLQPLTPAQSAPIDLDLSFFECCGNGFKDQLFQSGSISPIASILGDISNDGQVDIGDFTLWADAFGDSGTGLPADLSVDGQVDIGDFTIWGDNFGNTASIGGFAASAVPEPSAFITFGIGAFAVVAWGWRSRRIIWLRLN